MNNKDKTIIGILSTVIAAIFILGFTWCITCLVVKLICFCFGINFTILIGTGVWIILFILKILFTSSKE